MLYPPRFLLDSPLAHLTGAPLSKPVPDLSTYQRQPSPSLCRRAVITHMIVSREIADVAMLELSIFHAFLQRSQPEM